MVQSACALQYTKYKADGITIRERCRAMAGSSRQKKSAPTNKI